VFSYSYPNTALAQGQILPDLKAKPWQPERSFYQATVILLTSENQAVSARFNQTSKNINV